MDLPEHGTPVLDAWPDIQAGRVAVLAYDTTPDGHLIVRDAAAATYTDGLWDALDSNHRWFDRKPEKSHVHRGLTAASFPDARPAGAHACGNPGAPAKLDVARTCGDCHLEFHTAVRILRSSWRGVAAAVDPDTQRDAGAKALSQLQAIINGTSTWLAAAYEFRGAITPLLVPAQDAPTGTTLQVVSVPGGRVGHIAMTAATWTGSDGTLYRATFPALASLCGKPATLGGAPQGRPECRGCTRKAASYIYRAQRDRTQITVNGRTAQPDVIDMFDIDGAATILGLTP